MHVFGLRACQFMIAAVMSAGTTATSVYTCRMLALSVMSTWRVAGACGFGVGVLLIEVVHLSKSLRAPIRRRRCMVRASVAAH